MELVPEFTIFAPEFQFKLIFMHNLVSAKLANYFYQLLKPIILQLIVKCFVNYLACELQYWTAFIHETCHMSIHFMMI